MTTIIEKDYTDDEISYCGKLYTELVKSHDSCGGTGITKTADGFGPCECEAVYKYVKALHFSRIPKGFWGMSLDYLKNCFVLDKQYQQVSKSLDWFEESFVMCGPSGGGKTTVLAIIGKKAIMAGKNVMYITSEDLLLYLRTEVESKIFLDRINGADVVLFDNLNRFSKSAHKITQVEFKLRNFYDRGVTMYVTASTTEFETELSPEMSDFLAKIGTPVIIDGMSKTNGDNQKLSNYFEHSEFVKEAKIYYGM